MKRSWLARLALVPALALVLTGCRGEDKPDAPSGSSEPTVTTATGTYAGQNVTLSLVKETDYPTDQDGLYFHNGYVVFLNISERDDIDGLENNYTCLDAGANHIFTVASTDILHIGDNNCTYVTTEDGSYRRVNLNGDMTEVDEEEYMNAVSAMYETLTWEQTLYGTFQQVTSDSGKPCYRLTQVDGTPAGDFPTDEGQPTLLNEKLVTTCTEDGKHYLYGYDGKRIYEESFENIGTFYNGLAPFWQNGKLGLLGEDGSVVIPATVHSPIYSISTVYFNEDMLAVVNSETSHVSIYKVTRT
ncbi:MAG: hypothetical protein IJ518_00975 [Clostridia bacterium]|nr:hypothetical protein [Clostridia bacterium]